MHSPLSNVLTFSMKHPIMKVFNSGSLLFALNWFSLAPALTTGVATAAEETLLSWLNQPVSSDNPDDIIEVHKPEEPVFVRLGPRSMSLNLSGPFTSKGAQTMIKGVRARLERSVSSQLLCYGPMEAPCSIDPFPPWIP